MALQCPLCHEPLRRVGKLVLSTPTLLVPMHIDSTDSIPVVVWGCPTCKRLEFVYDGRELPAAK